MIGIALAGPVATWKETVSVAGYGIPFAEDPVTSRTEDRTNWQNFVLPALHEMLEGFEGRGQAIMRWRGELASPAWLCLALVGAAVIAGLVSGWNPTARKTDFSPAQIIALRFPVGNTVPPNGEQRSAANLFFISLPSFELASVPSGFVRSDLTEQAYGYIGSAADNIPAAAHLRQPRATKPPRGAGNPDDLFNDAQLASIEARLKLNADQQELWRPVESALRAIRWSYVLQGAGQNARKVRGLDLNSEELKRLKTVAAPLIMTLRADQKDEVRTLTRLMGLEQLASQI